MAGEAGIGKSRLVAEAARRAIERSCLVLRGGCSQTDSVCPYAPLLDLWRAYLSDLTVEERVARCGPGAAALQTLMPDLPPPLAGS